MFASITCPRTRHTSVFVLLLLCEGLPFAQRSLLAHRARTLPLPFYFSLDDRFISFWVIDCTVLSAHYCFGLLSLADPVCALLLRAFPVSTFAWASGRIHGGHCLMAIPLSGVLSGCSSSTSGSSLACCPGILSSLCSRPLALSEAPAVI